MTLHDIFPAVEIVEYSLYCFILLCIAILLGFWYFWRLYLKNKKRTRSYYISLLAQSTEDDAKQIAYKFAHYGKRVVRTSTHKEELLKLLALLEPFKYRENPPPLDVHIQKQLAHFLEVLRHKNVGAFCTFISFCFVAFASVYTLGLTLT